MNNRKFFEDGGADEWFRRNKQALEQEQTDKSASLLVDWLLPFKSEIKNLVEIGCGSGHRLKQITEGLNATGYGVEPSAEAVQYIDNNFPFLNVRVGFGDNIPFDQKFDLVHLGFFLYLVDREYYLRCISEADRLVRFGGFLSIIDFETPNPYSNSYSHKDGVFSHKHDVGDLFVASGLYSLINKFHFSHDNFFFHKDIDERVSLSLLYKETEVFEGT